MCTYSQGPRSGFWERDALRHKCHQPLGSSALCSGKGLLYLASWTKGMKSRVFCLFPYWSVVFIPYDQFHSCLSSKMKHVPAFAKPEISCNQHSWTHLDECLERWQEEMCLFKKGTCSLITHFFSRKAWLKVAVNDRDEAHSQSKVAHCLQCTLMIKITSQISVNCCTEWTEGQRFRE